MLRSAVLTCLGSMSMTSAVGDTIISCRVLSGLNWVRSARRLR